MKMKENYKKRGDLIQSTQADVINVVTPFIEKDLDIQLQSTNVKFVRRLATSVAYATGRLRKVIITKDYSSEDSFCLQLKVQPQGHEAKTKFTAPQHLVTNLEI